MATFTKSATSTARFERGDVHSVNISASDYTHNIIIQSRDNETQELQFANNQELKEFLDALLTVTLKIDWAKDYNNPFVYVGDKNNVTLKDVLGWKADSASLNKVIEG